MLTSGRVDFKNKGNYQECCNGALGNNEEALSRKTNLMGMHNRVSKYMKQN